MNYRVFAMSVLFASLLISTCAFAENLPKGTWFVVGGMGYQGELVISAVSSTGIVEGTIYGQEIHGVYDKTTNTLRFFRQYNEDDIMSLQIYTGYLFQDLTTKKWYLTGSIEGFTNAKRQVWGWVAEK